MSREKEIIKIISEILPRSESQLNRVFEADSEIVELAGKRLAVNVDDFSAEDQLREDHPETLGWNLALGALSDLFAAGARPLFYAHSLVTSPEWSDQYLRSFMKGVAAVLKKTQTSFIGGDLGASQAWRYTVTVLGVVEGEPLLRSQATIGDSIFITGPVGTGNMEAYLKRFSERKCLGKLVGLMRTRFSLRTKEADLIRKYSRAAIDTSDGVYNAVNDLAEASGTGFVIENIPYIQSGVTLAKLASVPKVLLLLGECGEYELLFTVQSHKRETFIAEAERSGLFFYELGRMVEPTVKKIIDGKSSYNMQQFSIRARDYKRLDDYIAAMIRFVEKEQDE